MADCPHGGFTTMCKYCDAETVERYRNQCDGCRRGLPIRISHIGSPMHDGEDGMPVMICTKDRYNAALERSLGEKK